MASEETNEPSVHHTARKIESGLDVDAYLHELCGDDPALRDQVEKRLSVFAEQLQSPQQSPMLFDTLVPETIVPDSNTKRQSPELPDQQSDSRYRLDGEIARGGMGAIIKGRDMVLGRDLAIKVLLDSHKDRPEVIHRFIEEAQIGGQLQHPGIAPIYELGQFADERPFFAMKLVKGETLSKLLGDRENPADERGKFIGIFEQICQTMAYAHSRGVIHRDLKPANIMVGAFGEVQVMDWGLAKVLSKVEATDETQALRPDKDQSIIQTVRGGLGSDVQASIDLDGSHTLMGSVMGTPAYMAPEQALGEIDIMNEQTDVFGLGAILCEILTGSPPYVSDEGGQILRMASRGKLEDAFQRLDVCGADEDLIALTRHCLKLEPTDRPRDAALLAERVTGYQESVEAKLREAEIARAAQAARADAEAAQALAERQRRRMSAALTGAVLLLVLLGGSGWLYMERQAAHRKTAALDNAIELRTLAEEHAQKLTERTERAIRAEAEAVEARIAQTHKSFSASLNQAQAQRWSRRTGQHFAAADALAQANELLQDMELESSDLKQRRQVLRNEFVAAMPLTDIRMRPVHKRDPLWAGKEALAPDFIRRAESNAAGDIRVLEKQKVLCSFKGPSVIGRFEFGPKGEFLYATYRHDKKRQLSIWSVKSGEKVLHVDEDLDYHTCVAISKSGLVAVGTYSRMVRVYSLDSGAVVDERQFDAFPSCVAFASEVADSLAVTSGKKLTIWSRSTGSTQETVTSNVLKRLAVTQDVVMVGDDVGHILQWPLDGLDSKPKAFVGHTGLIAGLFISSHDLVASSAWDGTSRLWNLRTGEQLLRVVESELTDARKQSGVSFFSPGFSVDGLLVANGYGTQVNTFEVTHSNARRVFWNPNRGGTAWDVAWHPLAPLLVVATDRGFNVWDSEKGRLLKHVRCNVVKTAVFVDNGAHLLTSGSAGVQKWPIKTQETDESTTVEVGEPELLAAGAVARMSINASLSIAAIIRQSWLELLSLDGAFKTVRIARVPNLDRVILSPDGKWLFTAKWNANGIDVYDVAKRKHVKTIAAQTGGAVIAVSPDGQLVASMKLLPQQVWKTGSWEKLTTLERPHSGTWPGAVAFSPSGHLLAITNDRFSARILETDRFADGVTLPSSTQQQTLKGLVFSPDERQVAVAFDQDVEVWDLDEVHRQLKAIDLDW